VLEFTTDVLIVAPPTQVLDAFFDAKALAAWWQAKGSVCVPRPLGSYAIQWEPTASRDEVLGRLGGALHARACGVRADARWAAHDAWRDAYAPRDDRDDGSACADALPRRFERKR